MKEKENFTVEELKMMARDVASIRNAIVQGSQPWQLNEGEAGRMVANRDVILGKIAKWLEPTEG